MKTCGNHSVRCIGDIQSPEADVFVPKVEAAWSALQSQYAGRITEAEVDHLFACFVIGLTTPDYAEQDPALHFDLCRALVAIKLPPERVEVVLHSVPEPTQPWVEAARQFIESKGVSMGSELRQHARNIAEPTGVNVNSSVREHSGNNEGNVQ